MTVPFEMRLLVFLTLVSLVTADSPRARAADVWKLTTFEDFRKGTFGDGGTNMYISALGRVELVNRWDLNHDGFIDLVFANSHPHVEKLDASIYWGNGKDFDGSRMSYVPNEGAQWTVAADLDQDGQIDAVIPNYTNGTWSKMDSAIYYGGAPVADAAWSVPPFARRLGLPTEAAQNAAAGDLNKDGHVDVVFALSAGFWEYRGSAKSLESPSRIFWGSKDGFARENWHDLEAAGASDVAIADLNKDSWPDLVIANRERAGVYEVGSYVYWGGADGFSPERRAELPTRQANSVCVSDINQDGRPDILFANGLGSTSYIYLNENGSFRPDRRIELPTNDARDCAAGDLNGDGRADIFFTNHQTAGNFATYSCLYWGGEDGFKPERRQEFETLGAWGVSLADLNGDKRPEIIVSNYREHVSFDVPSYIFWNGTNGFSDTLRTSLFTRGAIGNTVADFNGDGHADIIFNNTIGRTRGGTDPVFVYWGNSKGVFAPERRLELPGVEAYEWAAGDLNQDGFNDLVIANQAETGRKVTENFIYWGAQEGLSATRRSALMAHGGRGVSLADLDRDGFLDVVLFNSKPSEQGAFIYWGGQHGYVTTERAQLPGPVSGVPTIADLNNDSHLDLVLASGDPNSGAFIYWGDGTRAYMPQRRAELPESKGTSNSEVADLDRDGHLDLILTRRGKDASVIYHGNGRGEFPAPASQLKPAETQGVTVGDLNRDGWLDVIVPVYSSTGSRATLSRVHMGGPSGIPFEPTLELPTNAGTGSQIADYNRDGFNDLLLVCHRSEGNPNQVGAVSDHVTDSFLYWGGSDGLRADRKLLIPIRGAHYDSGVDMGNIYDRSLRFDYISPTHRYGRWRPERVAWKGETPHGSEIHLQIRTAVTEEALAGAEWTGPAGAGAVYQSPDAALSVDPDHTCIQWRARLRCPHGAATPSLDEVTVSFRPPLTGE